MKEIGDKVQELSNKQGEHGEDIIKIKERQIHSDKNIVTMTESVNKLAESVNKAFAMQYESKIEQTEINSELREKLMKVANESNIANMKQDYAKKDAELNGYKKVERNKDKLKFTFKSKVIGTLAGALALQLFGLWEKLGALIAKFLLELK